VWFEVFEDPRAGSSGLLEDLALLVLDIRIASARLLGAAARAQERTPKPIRLQRESELGLVGLGPPQFDQPSARQPGEVGHQLKIVAVAGDRRFVGALVREPGLLLTKNR
jgi:hypothetical protein